MTTTSDQPRTIPVGVWHVDTASSELAFSARGMFGLVPVHGKFNAFKGTLTVTEDGAQGDLSIEAASLDTGNAKRDQHLRSADFFNAESDPFVTFTLSGIEELAGDKLAVSGTLKIRAIELPLRVKVTSQTDGSGRLSLSATEDVDRDAVGLGWSKMGMIKGKAHLRVNVVLTNSLPQKDQ
jgi:polyisoprenoid-binding protein YceI